MLTASLLISLLSMAQAQPEAAGILRGQVIHWEDELPIPGVMITIQSDNLMGVQQTQTDSDGRFLFPELPPGIYSLTATRNNFETYQKVNMQVNAGRSTIVKIGLERVQPAVCFYDDNGAWPSGCPGGMNSGPLGVDIHQHTLYRLPGDPAQPLVSGPTWTGGRTIYLDSFDVTDPVSGDTVLTAPEAMTRQVWDGAVSLYRKTGSLNESLRRGQHLGAVTMLSTTWWDHSALVGDVRVAPDQLTQGPQISAHASHRQDLVGVSLAGDYTDAANTALGRVTMGGANHALSVLGLRAATREQQGMMTGARWHWSDPVTVRGVMSQASLQHTVSPEGVAQWRASLGLEAYSGLAVLTAGAELLQRTAAGGEQLSARLPTLDVSRSWELGQLWLDTGLSYDRAVLMGEDAETSRQGLAPRAGAQYTLWQQRLSLAAHAGRLSRLGRLAGTAPWSVDSGAAPADEVPLQADMVLLGIEHQTLNDQWLQAYVSRRVPSDEGAVAFQDDRLDLLYERHLRDGWEALVNAAYTVTTDTAERISVPCAGEGEVTDQRVSGQALAVWDTPLEPWHTRLGARLSYAQGRCGVGDDTARSEDWSAGVRVQQSVSARIETLFATVEVNDIGRSPTVMVGARFERN